MKTVFTIASAVLARVRTVSVAVWTARLSQTRMKIGRSMLAAMVLIASPAVHAQQAGGVTSGTQASANIVQPAAPKKTMAEKAAIAAGIFAIGFGAFKAVKAATHTSASQASAPPQPDGLPK